MIKSKKGISPLIATVLILGFTVALAAAIMTWGTTFTKNIQEGTSKSATAQISCAQDVSLTVKGVCTGGTVTGYGITISNDGTANIDSFTVRLYENANKAESVAVATPISSLGLNQIVVMPTQVASVDKVEVIPTITVEGNKVTCPQNVAPFGSLDNVPFTDAC